MRKRERERTRKFCFVILFRAKWFWKIQRQTFFPETFHEFFEDTCSISLPPVHCFSPLEFTFLILLEKGEYLPSPSLYSF
jgi:hypothetical protein